MQVNYVRYPNADASVNQCSIWLGDIIREEGLEIIVNNGLVLQNVDWGLRFAGGACGVVGAQASPILRPRRSTVTETRRSICIRPTQSIRVIQFK